MLCFAALHDTFHRVIFARCDLNGAPPLCTPQFLLNGTLPACKKAICGLSQNWQINAMHAGSTSPYTAAGSALLCGPRQHLWPFTKQASTAVQAGPTSPHTAAGAFQLCGLQ